MVHKKGGGKKKDAGGKKANQAQATKKKRHHSKTKSVAKHGKVKAGVGGKGGRVAKSKSDDPDQRKKSFEHHDHGHATTIAMRKHIIKSNKESQDDVLDAQLVSTEKERKHSHHEQVKEARHCQHVAEREAQRGIEKVHITQPHPAPVH